MADGSFRIRVELLTTISFEVKPALYGELTEKQARALLQKHGDLLHLGLSAGVDGFIRRSAEPKTRVAHMTTLGRRKDARAPSPKRRRE